MTMRVAAIVLAAGGGTRMGRTKQLMDFEGKTLLRRAVEAALSAGCAPVVVVIGAYAAKMRSAAELNLSGVEVIENPEWQNGMGTSIRAGMSLLEKRSPSPEAVLLTVCDQVLVGRSHLQQLISVHERTHKGLVAATYEGTVGAPAFFGAIYFSELTKMGDAEGAKRLLTRHADDLEKVNMPEAAVDLDRPEDFDDPRLQSPQ